MPDSNPQSASTAAAALAQELPPMPAWVPISRVWSLAVVTFTELVRSKVFYIVAIFGLIVLGSAAFLAQMDPEAELKAMRDISLGSMGLFTTLLAIAATAMLIPNDVEDRTLYTILAKPVTRIEYLLGKLFGVFLLLGALSILMTALSCVVLSISEFVAVQKIKADYAGAPLEVMQGQLNLIQGKTFTVSFFLGIILLYVKSCVISTICLAVSTITTSTIFTILCSSAIYFIGHVQGSAREYWMAQSNNNPGLAKSVFMGIVALLFPDLQIYNLSDDINAGNVVPFNVFGITAGWGLFFIAFYILIGYIIFSRKEL